MSFEKVLPERQHHPVINGTTESHYTEGTKVSVATSGKLLLKLQYCASSQGEFWCLLSSAQRGQGLGRPSDTYKLGTKAD
ncbi:hypothetical protein WJX82_005217 [Trebouxia sp. C0006]